MIDPSNIKQEKSSPSIKQEMRDASKPPKPKALHDMSDTSYDSENDSSDGQSENDSSSTPDNDSDASSSDNESDSSSSNSDSGPSDIYKIGLMKDRVKQELVDSSIIKQEKHDSPKVKQDKYRPNINYPKVKQEMRDSSSGSADGDSSDSESDSANKASSRSSDRDPSTTPSNLPVPSFKVLDNIIKTPSKYDVVESPGPLTVSDIKPENEYYIFRVPLGLINPIDLIDTKFCIGSKETRKIELNDKLYEVSTYENSTMPDMPTVFLPDNAGRLNQVDLQIKSHVVITQAPLNAIENSEFNIDDLRSKVHKPPEIKERNFFASSGAVKQIAKKEKLILKKKKLSKEEKRLSKEMKKVAEEKTLSKEKKNRTLEKEKCTSKKKKLSKEERKLSKEKKIAKGKKRLTKEKKLSKTKNILSEKGNPLPGKKKKRSLHLEENFSPSLSPNKKKKN